MSNNYGPASNNDNRNVKHSPEDKLMHPHYPVGHATGLSSREWREFADNYPVGKFDKFLERN